MDNVVFEQDISHGVGGRASGTLGQNGLTHNIWITNKTWGYLYPLIHRFVECTETLNKGKTIDECRKEMGYSLA